MKSYKLNEIKNKRILGRNIKSAGETDSPLALFWGAAALEVCVKASEVWVNFSSEYETSEPWVCVEVNRAPVSRFMVLKDCGWVCVARGLNPQKENLISIIKDTQPMSGEQKHSLFINELGLNDEGTFAELSERKLKIEFVGDSITSGEGLAGNPEEGEWIPQWFCASKTYAMQVSKKLNADWNVMSQCGWGIKWGWDGNRNSVIPPHYSKVCSVMAGEYQDSLGVNEVFDFGGGSDFVVINLGTNDNGAFSQVPWKDSDGKEYVLHKDGEVAAREDGRIVMDGIKAFLSDVRKYNPRAKIIWVWGMIKLTVLPQFFMEALGEYKKETGDADVYSIVLDSMEDVEKTPEDKGSRGHPGPKTHRLAAEKISDFIANLIK